MEGIIMWTCVKCGIQIYDETAFNDHVATHKQARVEAGTKFDYGKPPLELVSTVAMRKKAMVLDFGRQKYDAHNWRKGMSWSRLLGAAARHLFAYIGGEDKDPETGLSHLAHLACCTDFLLEYEETHPELDDRWNGAKNG